MKTYLLVLLTLSDTWGHLIIPDGVLESGEEDVPGMKQRRVRGLAPEEQQVGTFSTRPNHDENKSPVDFNYWRFSSPTPVWSAYATSFNDPFWKSQWYQQDIRTTDGPVMDHNIVPVQRMGFNGKGISIGILGERLGQELFDMKGRVKEIFKAIEENSSDQEKTETLPTLASKVAGVIAMNANNSLCGAGIAYKAEITGITVMKDDEYEKNMEYIIKGMQYTLNSLDIYVDAIMRSHDGITMPFSPKIKNSLAEIATKGRGKKGGIYVVGAGNGGEYQDNCGADYIVNSIHTFVIGSVSGLGLLTKYSEQCCAILATAYSSENLEEDQSTKLGLKGIVTINGKSSCTEKFGGTAASAAIASGIFALTLQANPDLSLRDLMHVTAMSSEKAPLYENEGWHLNSAGFYVSRHFGFGLLNAENMVLASLQWEPVPKMITCKLKFKKFGKLKEGHRWKLTLEVETCPSINKAEGSVKYIEQVELVTTISYFNRGAISILLTSPNGTMSHLLQRRRKDKSSEGFKKWSFRSLRHWGEQPFGTWKLTIDAEYSEKLENTGCLSSLVQMISVNFLRLGSLGYIGDQIRSAQLLIHGTSDVPKHYQQKPSNQLRTYAYSPDVGSLFK